MALTQAEKTKLYRATVTTHERFRALREEKGAYHPDTVRAWDEHTHAKRRFERAAGRHNHKQGESK